MQDTLHLGAYLVVLGSSKDWHDVTMSEAVCNPIIKSRLIRQQCPALHTDVAAVDCLHVTLTPHLNQKPRQYIERVRAIVDVKWH